MRFSPTADETAYQETVREFVQTVVGPRAAEVDRSNAFPRDIVDAAGRQGLMGATIPTDEGGGGVDYVRYALAIEEVSAGSATVGAILAVNNPLVVELVAAFGSPAQRDHWLRPLASGQSVGAFALSEQDAGTDAANQQTVAHQEGSGYRLCGRKVWVANAVAADVFVVFAATTPGVGARGVSAFLVPSTARGLTLTDLNDALGVRGLGVTDVLLDDVCVGPEALIGTVGRGFDIAMRALDGGRIAIGAQALGIGRAALDAALSHARARTTFGRPIAEYQAIQWMLADMATELDAARMLVGKAAAARDHQERCTLEASMAKLAASEAAHRAADTAMQILASAGYRRGSTVERLFRDARATEIYQGTSEVQRLIIASKVLSS